MGDPVTISEMTGLPHVVLDDSDRSVQLARLMACVNTLHVINRCIERLFYEDDDNFPDMSVFKHGYFNSLTYLATGVLKEGLDAIRALGQYFHNLESELEQKGFDKSSLPNQDLDEVMRRAPKDSVEYNQIKSLRNEVGFHWKHTKLSETARGLGTDTVPVLRAVNLSNKKFVRYPIADFLLAFVALANDEEEFAQVRVDGIVGTMRLLINVVQQYLEGHFCLTNCTVKSEEALQNWKVHNSQL